MNTNTENTFLFTQLDAAVEKYKKESKNLKRWAFTFRVTMLFVAATITVLLGWNLADDEQYAIWSRNAALALGAFNTFLLGVSTYWNIDSYALKQKVMFARVRALREQCSFLESQGKLDIDAVNDAFEEYRRMMDSRIDYWETVAARKAKNK